MSLFIFSILMLFKEKKERIFLSPEDVFERAGRRETNVLY